VLPLLEAGGRVTDVRGNDLDFGLGYRLEDNLGVIVSNEHQHEAIMGALRKSGLPKF